MENCDRDRLYRIQHEDYQFESGHNPAGEQILVGKMEVGGKLLLAIIFSPEGHHLRCEFFPIVHTPDPSWSAAERNRRRIEAYRHAKLSFKQQLQMTPGTISIHHFAFPEWGIGIAEWPLADFAEVQEATATGRPLTGGYLIDWKASKQWVMLWHGEFWMSDDGEILAS